MTGLTCSVSLCQSLPVLKTIDGIPVVLISIDQMDSITKAFIHLESAREVMAIQEQEISMLHKKTAIIEEAVEVCWMATDSFQRSLVLRNSTITDLKSAINIQEDIIGIVERKNKRLKWSFGGVTVAIGLGVGALLLLR